jgi:hypothetical protein
MNAILFDKINLTEATNVQVISLDDAPQGYKDFDKGAVPVLNCFAGNCVGLSRGGGCARLLRGLKPCVRVT